MNHFNDQAYYGHHLGPQPSSALLLSAGHRFLAAKLAAAAAASSSTSSEQGTSSSSPSNNCKSSLTSSILYSAISAAAAASSAKPSTFAIPQLPPPLVSVNGCGSSQPQLQQQQQQQQSSSSSSFYPNLVSVSSQPRQQQQHHNHHYHHQHQNQQQQQQPRPVDVYAFTEGNSCVGSSTSSAVTSTTSTTRGRGRGRGSSSALGRPPKSRSAAVSASSSSSSAFTSRSYGINGSSAIREPPPPPSAPQVAAVAGAHQNESHNSLAASMPLLSTYLMKGTITGYHNGHQMGKKGNNSYGVAVQQQQQQKQQQANGNCEPVHSNGLSTVCHLNAALESAGLPASQHQHHHKRHNHQQQQQQQRPPSVEVIEESDDDESSDESVRFGRVPKREKAKILAAMQKVNAHSLDKALSAVLEDEQCISVTIATAHEETCDYTREKVAPLLEAARSRPVYAQCPPSMTCPLNPIPIGTLDPAQSARILEDFSERFSPAIRGVVDFAKRIPGFGMLSQEDQVTLLKAGVFEVLLVRLACMFDSPSASMVCLNGLVLRRDALHSASNARFLLDSMFDFAERLNSLRLSDHEIGLFCAVVVIAPDRPGLRNVDLVTKINKRLEEVLQKTIAGNHPNDVASGQLIFTELTKKIPDLRTLNTLHSEKLIGKNFIAGESVASSTTNHHHHHHQEMASSGAAAVHSHHSHHSQSSQQQPDSSDNSPSDRWSSSSSLGHFSPATSTEDGRSVSPTSGPWGEHQQKQQQQQSSSSDSQAFGSPRSMSSSSGVSSEDSHSRKGSISLPSAPPKLAYINSYVRGLSSPVVVSSEHGHCPAVVSSEEAAASTASSHYNSSHHLHPYSKPVQHPVNGHHHQLSTTVSGQQQQQQHRVDSPTDSGIDHHSSSVCSSPSRSSAVCPVEESSSKCSKLSVVIAGSSSPRSHSDHSGSALTSSSSDSECSEKQESIDDMPVLKRALQAPPLVNTNKLMDEAYRHHKKFRAAARRDTEPHSPSTTTGHSGSHSPLPSPVATVVTSSPPAPNSSSISSSSLASTHSTLLKTLEQPSRYLSEQQLKRTDLIHNIIMNSEAVTAAAASALSASVPVAAQLSSPVYQHGLFSGASAKDSLYPAGASFYHHAHPHHQMPAVCPFTGRSASGAAAVPSSSASPSSSSSPSTYQLPAHFAKSPEVAAAAAGLLVIGSSVPPPPMVSVSGGAAVPMPSSSSSGQQQHSSPVVMVSPSASYHHQQQTMGSPYSHLARCLTATTAPALVHQRSPASAASPSHHDDQDDAQPLNLSKKAACPAVGSTLRQSLPVISCPSSASSNSLKMEVDA